MTSYTVGKTEGRRAAVEAANSPDEPIGAIDRYSDSEMALIFIEWCQWRIESDRHMTEKEAYAWVEFFTERRFTFEWLKTSLLRAIADINVFGYIPALDLDELAYELRQELGMRWSQSGISAIDSHDPFTDFSRRRGDFRGLIVNYPVPL